MVLYDSLQNQSAEGKYAFFDEILLALSGKDVFHCTYENGAIQSFSAVPVMTRETVAGCVYMMEYDSEQGIIIQNLERNILRGSFILLAVILIFAGIFTWIGSKRMSKVLRNMRMAREGEYDQKIKMRGNDEYTKLATEFNKLTDRLQQSEQVQRQFISDASHELKTPLASIKLLSDSILQNAMDADTMREFVAAIGNESDRLTRMAQKLLTLNRSEETKPEHVIVDLGKIVSRVYRMLDALSDRSGVELTANVSGTCTILSFEDDAYQIVFNLVENAIKYNQSGGSVHVTLQGGEDEVRLEVRDTGVGIPENALEHIFERFYRVDKARSRQAGGSGLGLSIVRELVERNFGTISVQSKEAEGSCFTVIFPFIGVGEENDDEN
ncbi:MAG: HAMP domain-containing histidine kinase [Clostridia bacterium]|nr:HAMP domain-containing histidine kinase [Clostridia bacterium]